MREELERLLNDLRAALKNPRDKDAFARVLSEAIKLLDLSDEDIAKRFDTSRPTITRWRNATNAPHPAMRPAVYEWLLGLADARLQRYLRAEQQQAQSRGYGGSSYPSTHPMAARGR